MQSLGVSVFSRKGVRVRLCLISQCVNDSLQNVAYEMAGTAFLKSTTQMFWLKFSGLAVFHRPCAPVSYKNSNVIIFSDREDG